MPDTTIFQFHKGVLARPRPYSARRVDGMGARDGRSRALSACAAARRVWLRRQRRRPRHRRAGPFPGEAASPAWRAGLRRGDRLDLAAMRCIPVDTPLVREPPWRVLQDNRISSSIGEAGNLHHGARRKPARHIEIIAKRRLSRMGDGLSSPRPDRRHCGRSWPPRGSSGPGPAE